MLLSFNNCSISALNAPINQSVEETQLGKNTRKSNSTMVSVSTYSVCHRSLIGLYVYNTT